MYMRGRLKVSMARGARRLPAGLSAPPSLRTIAGYRRSSGPGHSSECHHTAAPALRCSCRARCPALSLLLPMMPPLSAHGRGQMPPLFAHGRGQMPRCCGEFGALMCAPRKLTCMHVLAQYIAENPSALMATAACALPLACIFFGSLFRCFAARAHSCSDAVPLTMTFLVFGVHVLVFMSCR
jgi:hypothetical protein